MLVLTLKEGQSVVIGDGVVVKALDVRLSKVRIGIQAPPEIVVMRKETHDRIIQQNGGHDDPAHTRNTTAP